MSNVDYMRAWVEELLTEGAKSSGYVIAGSPERVGLDLQVTTVDAKQYRILVYQVAQDDVARGRPGDFLDRTLRGRFPH